MTIALLNHACIILTCGRTKLLMDPWLSGTCFEGGWGLKYENSASFEQISDCTHLWISHFHSDHFHVPTLKKILEINPGITVLGNRSFNFQLDDVMKKIGFTNVISFPERKTLKIADDLTLKRYPTTGIDCMLHIQTPEGTILNYNDCNLPERARLAFAKKLGKVDVFLSNYNHAGKIIEYPMRGAEEIKAALANTYLTNAGAFSPKYLLPFASHHYYRAEESLEQNAAMMTTVDLLPMDSKIIPVGVGDVVSFPAGFESYSIAPAGGVTRKSNFSIEERKKSYSAAELTEACDTYRRRIRRGFPLVSRLIPALDVEVADLGKKLRLDVHKGLVSLAGDARVHIVAHSESLYNWWSKPYGTDGFVVGAHFRITDEPIPLKWQTLTGLMVENRLDLRSMVRMICSRSGIRFLINRREEIFAILMKGKLQASEQR